MTFDPYKEMLCKWVENEGCPRFALAPCELPQTTPEPWRKIFRSSDPVRSALDWLWSPWHDLLPQTVAELKRKLHGIGVLETRARPFSLVYILEAGGKPLFRRGYPSEAIEVEEAQRLPGEFLDLYTIHNGWTDMNGFMGPLPSKNWFPLSYVVGEESSVGLRGIQAKDFLVVCESGGSGYLGFDLSKTVPVGLVYSIVDPVEVTPDVVGKLDDWIAVDLQDLT